MQDDPREPQHPAEQPISIQDEMRTSYLDYAMSVIIGRAIPDVRDGLKPVHRRILYAMRDLNLSPGGSYSKCAKVVGQVLGNYHPHGDAAVYDALVRMAQDFSLRHMLIDGQGNFGSIDGDPAAAYRYTECRLARISSELLADIDKETVDFSPNFDESTQEPDVLPARFPNLLVNGTGGIAVGMATNIPPHNLVEVIDATVHLILNPDCNVADLMKFINGPDFPTAGMIYGRAGIAQAYLTGRGSIIMRARTEVEKVSGGDREQIVVTEIPYQVNKARLHAKIGELMRDKRIEGIREARDESDRDGMRLVLELKKDVFPTVVLNQLYRMTDLQTSFGIINLSIVNGRPAVLDLKETLRLFVEHRRDVVSRRTRFELAKAEGQRDLVEGLGMAITEVDLVIKTIRESSDPEVAQKKLMTLPLRGLEEFVRRAGRPETEIAAAKQRGEYRLSERQAKAILEMRLARLTGLEQEKLAAEYGELSEEIAHLRTILADEQVLMALIIKELEEVKEKHGQKRRTEIVDNEAEILIEDLIQEEEMVVTISHSGYIKRTPVSTYRAQKRGGKGTQGMEARDDDDFVTQLFIGSTHSFIFFFSTSGKVFVKKVYEIPQAARNAKGRAIVNFLELPPEEKVETIAQVRAIEAGWYVTTITRGGQIKKTEIIEYENYRDKGIIGVKIVEGDSLLSAIVTDGKAEFLIATKQGQSIRFDEQQVRPMGRGAAGVKAIDLAEGDQVVGLARTEPERQFVLAVCERGYGKRTVLEEFRVQNRGGKGIILIECSDRNGPVVGIAMVKPTDEVMLITDRGQTIRTPVEGIRETGRNTQGVKLMRIGEEERVVAIEPIGEGAAQGLDEEENGEESGEGEGETATSESQAPRAESPAGQGSGEEAGGEEEGAGGEEER
ncbi:MAG TPA: DNA gyrase subunit A [Polyangiaceae bacterium]|nr:DNA gyrase subunit A [Polyangiaceae bacterium]